VLLISSVCWSWEKSQRAVPKPVLLSPQGPLDQRVLSADYFSLCAHVGTDFKAGNTQVKYAAFLDKLVEKCQLFFTFFLYIFFLKWK